MASFEIEVQANNLKQILEEKYKGNWIVIIGLNMVSLIPYVDNCYLSFTFKGVKYVLAKVA